jgi:hypothetical protein
MFYPYYNLFLLAFLTIFCSFAKIARRYFLSSKLIEILYLHAFIE